jgi:hypothetical protein
MGRILISGRGSPRPVAEELRKNPSPIKNRALNATRVYIALLAMQPLSHIISQ